MRRPSTAFTSSEAVDSADTPVSIPKTTCYRIYSYGRGLYTDGETSSIVNKHNPVVASVMRCNHDVNCTPSSLTVLAAVYHMTNYATKPQVDPDQLVLLTAAVLKKAQGMA
jgi:hypothetical protein